MVLREADALVGRWPGGWPGVPEVGHPPIQVPSPAEWAPTRRMDLGWWKPRINSMTRHWPAADMGAIWSNGIPLSRVGSTTSREATERRRCPIKTGRL